MKKDFTQFTQLHYQPLLIKYAIWNAKILQFAVLTLLINLALCASGNAADFAGNLKEVIIKDVNSANNPSTAAFTYTVSGDIVTFDASNSTDTDGSISQYKWNFGDNTTGSGQKVSHSYTNFGDFFVTLTLIDSGNAVSLLQKNITYNTADQIVGNGAVGANGMASYPNHVAFHKLSGTASSSGTLSSFIVSVTSSIGTSKEINISLYTHDALNDKPLDYVSGSECGWATYSLATGSTFECTPVEDVAITAGQQYWIGVRGKNYGGILGDNSKGTYYDYYLSDTSSWKSTTSLATQTTKPGLAGILQIKVSQ